MLILVLELKQLPTYTKSEKMTIKNIQATVSELNKILNINNYVGDAIETETATLIPVMRIGVGFGAGGNTTENSGLEAAGGGAGVEPVSMVVVLKNVEGPESVRVLNLTKGNDVNKAISDLTPMVIDLIKQFIPDKNEEEDDEGEYVSQESKTVIIDEE